MLCSWIRAYTTCVWNRRTCMRGACVRIDQSGLCKCFQCARYNGCSETMPATSLPLEWWFIIIFTRALQIVGRHWEMHEDFSQTVLLSLLIAYLSPARLALFSFNHTHQSIRHRFCFSPNTNTFHICHCFLAVRTIRVHLYTYANSLALLLYSWTHCVRKHVTEPVL